MKYLLWITLALASFDFEQVAAQEPYVYKGFVILQSTKSYEAAFRTVNKARKLLDVPVDLRDLVENVDGGLRYMDTDPGEGDGGLCEYIPRGRWDDGVYLSIEYSDYFEGFTVGYYIVVLASGPVNEILYNAVEDAFTFYPDVYIKKSSVHIGCMH